MSVRKRTPDDGGTVAIVFAVRPWPSGSSGSKSADLPSWDPALPHLAPPPRARGRRARGAGPRGRRSGSPRRGSCRPERLVSKPSVHSPHEKMGKNGLPSTTSLPCADVSTAARRARRRRWRRRLGRSVRSRRLRLFVAVAREQDHRDHRRQQEPGRDGDVLPGEVASSGAKRLLAAQPPGGRAGAAQRFGGTSGLRCREQHLDRDLRPRAPGSVRRQRPRASLRPHPVADSLVVEHERARRASLVDRRRSLPPSTDGASRRPSADRARRRGAVQARSDGGGRGPRRRRAGRRAARQGCAPHARAARPHEARADRRRRRPPPPPSRRSRHRRTQRLRTRGHQPAPFPPDACSKQTNTAPTA